MNFKVLFFNVCHRAWLIMILLPILTVLIPLPAAHADPSAFSLLSPEDGASVLTDVLLDWEDSADPMYPDTLVYRIILSEEDPDFKNPIEIEEIDNSCYLLKNCSEDDSSCLSEESIKLNDGSTYYWKVEAMNDYLDSSLTEVWSFQTDNQNPVKAWIGGHVYNSFNNPISNIIMRVLRVSETLPSLLETDSDGNFCGELGDDKVSDGVEEDITIKISVEGCIPKEINARIVLGELTPIEDITLEFDGKGDINGDGDIDLIDAILALRIMAGLQVPISEDVLGKAALSEEDQKIGLLEIVYILQKIVSPSPCTLKND